MTSPATTDLCDAHPEIQVCEPVFQVYGGRDAFSGPITTLKVFEDNSLVREAVQQPGEGRVLVVDGGGSLALLALRRQPRSGRGEERLGRGRRPRLRARRRELAAEPVGVRALATIPRKSKPGLHSGQAGLPVLFAGVVFREGEWLCADADGVVVLPEAAHGRMSRQAKNASMASGSVVVSQNSATLPSSRRLACTFITSRCRSPRWAVIRTGAQP